MNPSLSVVLPVHNAQDHLSASVAEILDVLPELSQRFEVLIVDDGSTDETSELARDLARCYPQVNVVRHPVRLGLTEAVQSGLDHTCGDIVFVGDERYGLDPDDLRKLWRLRGDEELVMARAVEPAAPKHSQWLERLLAWKPEREAQPAAGGVHMLRRRALAEMQWIDQRAAQSGGRRLDRPAASDQAHEPQRPNYLTRLKQLTRRS